MADSAHEAILDGVELILAGLNLDGLQNNLHLVELIDQVWANNVTLPAIAYGPGGIEEDLGTGSNAQEDWGYPVVIRVVESYDATKQNERIPQHLKYRKLIRRAFVHKRLSGVTTQWDCVFKPSPVIEQTGYDFFSMPIYLQFFSREPRT